MAQFSVKIMRLTGSVLGENQQARIQKHTAHAGARSFHGLSKTTPEQLDLFDALNLPKPA